MLGSESAIRLATGQLVGGAGNGGTAGVVFPIGAKRGVGTRSRSGIFQCSITVGTATVNIEGRCDPLAPWVVIMTFTNTSGAQAVELFREMRVNITAIAGGGVVDAWLDQ